MYVNVVILVLGDCCSFAFVVVIVMVIVVVDTRYACVNLCGNSVGLSVSLCGSNCVYVCLSVYCMYSPATYRRPVCESLLV